MVRHSTTPVTIYHHTGYDILDPSAFFTFANDFRPLRANHRFKLKLASAIVLNILFFIRITDKWNNLPKEIAEAENLNIFKNRLRRHLIDFSTEY